MERFLLPIFQLLQVLAVALPRPLRPGGLSQNDNRSHGKAGKKHGMISNEGPQLLGSQSDTVGFIFAKVIALGSSRNIANYIVVGLSLCVVSQDLSSKGFCMDFLGLCSNGFKWIYGLQMTKTANHPINPYKSLVHGVISNIGEKTRILGKFHLYLHGFQHDLQALRIG